MLTIVIIEDDESIRAMLTYYLRSVGYRAADYESGEEYFARREQDGVQGDLFILDGMLPGMDGLDILRALKKDGATADKPVIMLTARSAELDKVTALDIGADDYIAKPFGLMELGARVKAVLRRVSSGPALLTHGDLTIDPAGRTVKRGGKAVELTYKEFELLTLLVSRKGTVLTRDEILSGVWGYDFTGETRTVDMHVKTLRQKLGEGYITTVRGVGYKAELEEAP